MFDTYTHDQLATTLTHDQLATKLALIEQVVFDLYLDITTNIDSENFSEETEIALTKVVNALYQAIHTKDLF